MITVSAIGPARRTKGVALVTVLALLVLITALIVGFLLRVGTEGVASSNYAGTATTRFLADTAVNVVQAQINEATILPGTNTWASQPGAIRVFNDDGDLTKIYKLYSAATLAPDATSGNVLASDIPPALWADSPALWTDLNAPVKVAGMTDSAGVKEPDYLVYPILDPRDPADPAINTAIPGFSIDATAPGATAQQRAPMPVRWLYVLEDGRIIAPTGTGRTATISGATKLNPIVGRIAFWTDDETSKVNINTAAGSFSEWGTKTIPATWDTPRFKIWEERMLFSENQPVKGEYQRYPGHPATTDLFGILEPLGVTLADYPYSVSNTNLSPLPNVSTSPSETSEFFSLSPRYSDENSSRGGSRNSTKVSLAGTAPQINNGIAKLDRLLPSVGEVMFAPNRAASDLTRKQLESGKFFLTAQNRSPETTLFGTPRIAMWPVDAQNVSTRRTAYDKLIAFCATTAKGAMPYFLQRSDSRSATSDFNNINRNKDLFAYLKDLTSRKIPGFGGRFSDKYAFTDAGVSEREQILTEMLDYIRCTNLHDNSVAGTSLVRFTDNPSNIPGGDFSFQGQASPLKVVDAGATTRGLGRAYTFSEIGVQIICTADGGSPLGPYQPPVTVDGQQVSPVKGSANDPKYASNLPTAQYLRDNTGTNGKIIGWNTSVTPNVVTTGTETTAPTTGGPFPANQTLTTNGEYGGPLQALAAGEKKLQAMLLFDIACPMMGYDPFQTSIKPAFRVNVSGIQGLSIASQNPFPDRTNASNAKTPNLNGNGFLDGIATRSTIFGTGGTLGFRYLLGEQGEHFNGWSGNTPSGFSGPRPYRYVSNPFTVSSAGSMGLSGSFTAELHYLTSSTTSDAYQTFQVDFPNVTNVPLPDLMTNGLGGNNASGSPFLQNVPADWWGFDFRIARANQPRTGPIQVVAYAGPGAVIRSDAPLSTTPWQWSQARNVRIPTFANQNSNSTLYSGSDVVRTLVARDGDYRLSAAQDPVVANGTNTSAFAKGPGYDDGVKLGHLFKDQGNSFNTAGVDNGGKLVANANYSWKLTPKVPSSSGNPAYRASWDWDNGLPNDTDGAYAGKPDEGNIYTNNESPYYSAQEAGSTAKITAYFTANRIVNSPVMFGSLPTGVIEGVAWRTPLFRPSPAANRPLDPPNPTGTNPKDHLLLDLFWMPVVEPFAISEPFSTAGKVNMNYQIVPFTYIHRSSGVRSVLSSELIPRVPLAAAPPTDTSNTGNGNNYYKGKPGSATPSTPPGGPSVARLPVNLDETLEQFEAKFADSGNPLIPKDIFKSASEICDIYLVPEGYTYPGFDATWYGTDFAMVGDNSRERPYSNIYPRLTTKSNTFTVHYTVQSLKNPSANPADWTEGRGAITGEYRGSTTLERFLDPNNLSIPDYATTPNAPSLDTFYQWRVIANNAFTP